MICPYCFHKKTKTTNSRAATTSATVWRRHSCPNCHADFTSYETVAPTIRITDANTNQPFSLGQLHLSIASCFSHQPDRAGQDSLELAKTVQTKLLTKGDSLSRHQLATITHSVLHQFDPIAALQYAARHQLLTSTKRRPGRPATRYRTTL